MSKNNVLQFNVVNKTFECPDCNSADIKTDIIVEKFKYGTVDKFVELEASIPLRKCQDCGFEYTDFEAEDIQHEVICCHLGVMTPNEIIALRKDYKLTRAQFAQLTQIGEASLARWETGELIQNAAYDNYLYLLKFRTNIDLLRNRRKDNSKDKGEEQQKLGKAIYPNSGKFRALPEDILAEKLTEAQAFRL